MGKPEFNSYGTDEIDDVTLTDDMGCRTILWDSWKDLCVQTRDGVSLVSRDDAQDLSDLFAYFADNGRLPTKEEWAAMHDDSIDIDVDCHGGDSDDEDEPTAPILPPPSSMLTGYFSIDVPRRWDTVYKLAAVAVLAWVAGDIVACAVALLGR